MSTEGVDFGNTRDFGRITGLKFEDVDGDGVRNAGESGLSGWTISATDGRGTHIVTVSAGATVSGINFGNRQTGGAQQSVVTAQEGEEAPSGVYLYRLTAGAFAATRQMTLFR